MKKYLQLLFFALSGLCLFWTTSLGQELYLGMEKEALIEILGEPTSQASRGGRELLFFGGGIQVTVRDGVVKKIKGTDYALGPPDQFEPEEVPEPELPVVEVEKTDELVVEPLNEPEVEQVDAPPEDEVVDETQEMINAVGEFSDFSRNNMTDDEAMEAFKGVMMSEMGMEEEQADALLEGFGVEETEEERSARMMKERLVGFVVLFVISLALIKAGFVFYGFTLLNSEWILICLGYSLFGLIMSFIPWGIELRSLFKVDEILGFFVLTLLIFHLTAVTNGVTALKIAFTTSIVAYLGGAVIFMIATFFL